MHSRRRGVAGKQFVAGRLHLVFGNGGDTRERLARVVALMTAPEAVIALHNMVNEASVSRRNFHRVGNEAAEMAAADDDHGGCAKGDAHMRRTSVVADHQRCLFQQTEELWQIGLTT